LRTAGAVAAADIAVERVEGGRVAFLAIQLVDTEGTPVPIDDRPVSVTVEGGATLMGLGSASPVTEHSFLHAECLTFEGRAQAIIGMIEGQEAMVVVSVDGLPPHTVSV
jgi:beta-galactosidase